MLNKITVRTWFVFVSICCVSLLGYALYEQYVDYIEPCPLCILQRVAFVEMGVLALLGALHNPARMGQRVYTWLIALGAGIGSALAGRHVWLQQLPADQVPECGPGLNYMLENFPLNDVLSTVLKGSGSCAEMNWSFLGMSIPMWTFIWFVGLGLVTLWFTYRRSSSRDHHNE